MADITSLFFQVVMAITFFGLFSSFYKRSRLFSFLAHMLIGVSTAFVCVQGIDVVINDVYGRITGGEPIFIMVIIIGLLYFTAVIPKLRSLYRGVTVVQVAIGLGLTLQLSMVKVWDWTVNIAGQAFTGVGPFLAMVFLLTGISNFLFSKVLEKPTRISREVGRLGLLIYSAFIVGSGLSFRISNTMFYVLRVMQGNAWWIPLIIFAGIIIDATGILKRPQEAQVQTET